VTVRLRSGPPSRLWPSADREGHGAQVEFLATVAGYLASVWRRLTAPRIAAAAIFLAETAALCSYLYLHW
jgi:hypothetical protein